MSTQATPSTLLVPYDGSDLSAQAVPYAIALARITGDRLLIVQVADIDETAQNKAKQSLESLVAQVNNSGLTIFHIVDAGNPKDRIVTLAREQHCRAIVMTTHGRSGLGRWIYGSVTDAVVRESTVPVLVVPNSGTATSESFRAATILVALDGSKTAEQIIPATTDLAAALGGRVLLMQAVVPYVFADTGLLIEPGLPQADPKVETELAQAYLAGVAERIQKRGLPVETLVERGSMQIGIGTMVNTLVARETAATIGRVAAEHDAALVAITTHGTTGLGRALIGSVASSMLHHGRLPVLIERSAERD